MPSLYKYLPAKHVDAFMHRGEVLFRALSYFRDYEDAQVRGDEFEGTKLYRPKGGLEITLVETQEKRIFPHSFESAANEDDIFVFCLSTELSPELATQFNANACIEIVNPQRFISGVRSALLRRPSVKDKTLVHGDVRYYAPDEPAIVDWALPEKIAMSKLDLYSYSAQKEYRLAFAVNGAFKVENTRLRLVNTWRTAAPKVSGSP